MVTMMDLLGSIIRMGYSMAGSEPISFEQTSEYNLIPPALLFGPSGRARSDAADLIRDAGLRLADVDLLDGALSRLERQGALGLVWVETAGEAIEENLLHRLEEIARSGPGRLVVSVGARQIDDVVAALGEVDAQILIDATTIERASALAVALAKRDMAAQKSDIGRANAAPLNQISDEIGRIAATLARVSTDQVKSSASAMVGLAVPQEVPSVDPDTINSVIRARRMRGHFFSEELFADPAWDMLLDLLQAEIAQNRVLLSSLCTAASVPATTALRWIKSLTDAGMFVRRADPQNGQLVFVELAPVASAAMRRYFGEVGNVDVI